MRKILFYFLAVSYISCQYGQIEPAMAQSGYWSFDKDSAGTVVDLTDWHTDGTPYNVSYSNVASGKCMDFLQAENSVLFPDKDSPAPSGVGDLKVGSISVWFKFKSLAEGQILPILYYGEKDTGTPHNSLIIEIGHGRKPSNRKLYFTIVNKRFCFDSGENLEENRWYHFVAVVSDAGNTGYLDGKCMVNRQYNLGSDSTYSDFFADVPEKEVLALGYGRYGQEDPFFHFRGSLDEVSIWQYAMAQEEVLTIYREGKSKILGAQAGINQHGNNPGFNIYPNPASHWINIHCQETISNLKIIGITGQSYRLEHPGKRDLSLDVSNLPQGLYFIRINDHFSNHFLRL